MEKEIEQIIIDWLKSGNENTTHLAHLIMQRVSPSEDKTAEEILMKHFFYNGEWREKYWANTIMAMTEYATLRINKAIEEAVKRVESLLNHKLGPKRLDEMHFIERQEVISELNKLKV